MRQISASSMQSSDAVRSVVHIFVYMVLVSTRKAASVQIGRHEVIIGGSLHTGSTWLCFVSLYPLEVVDGDAVEGFWRLGKRWRGVGDWGCDGGVWARTVANRSVFTSSHQKTSSPARPGPARPGHTCKLEFRPGREIAIRTR